MHCMRPPASAQTVETTNEMIINPTDPGKIVDVNSVKASGDIRHSRIQGFGEFTAGFSTSVNRANLIKKIKRFGNRKRILRSVIYCIWKAKRSVN